LGWTEIADGVRSFDGPVFGFAWPLPLFDRNQGRREAASAEVSRARFELEVAQKKALEQSRAALASYTEFYAMVVRGAAGDADSDVVDTMLAVFEAGEASLTDVLDALRATVDVRMARIEALARALAAERELESALGRPLLSGGSS
jgi:outer membrane protein TolC